MSNRNVAFAEVPSNAPDPLAEPTGSPEDGGGKRGGYTRLWLPDHFQGAKDLLLKLHEGDNLIRFVPALPGGYLHFILPALLCKFEGVEFVTAVGQEALDINNRVKRDNSPVADAFWWFKKNHPEQLHDFAKNPRGFQLSRKKVGIAWVISYDEEKKQHLQLVCASLYSGDKGTKGVLGDILVKAKEEDVDPESGEKTPKFGDISHPTEGNFVNIAKVVDKSAKTPEQKMKGTSYQVSISTKKSKPVQELLDLVPDAEFNRLAPLEKVVDVASEEMQHQALKAYIGLKWWEKIFTDAPAMAPKED